MADALLRLNDLGKDFGTTVALRSLTCAVFAGEIVGLLGPNGSGKTTTMKLLMGTLRPSRGSASFDDRAAAPGDGSRLAGTLDCTRDARRIKERIGFTPDEPAYYDFLTGRETITFALNVRGCPVEASWERLASLVGALGLEDSLDKVVGGYSHGTKKKLALVLALAHSPSLLLLDEPTNGLDPPTAARIRALLRDYARGGGAVVVSTHLLAMAETMCDRVLVLHEGALVAEGSAAQVKAQAEVAPDASLEEAFLRIVGSGGSAGSAG
jgi:ABC-2 type transport system ATP-binding protein